MHLSPNPIISPAFHPLAIGDKGDAHASPEQISAIVSILIDAGICCCFVQEYALVYYGTRRLPNDRILCVPDEQHQRAIQPLTSRDDILNPCAPLPLRRPGLLSHKYSRFKAIGRTGFWLLLPASGLPHPNLPIYTQSLLDTKTGVDLEDLIDGMKTSEEWEEQNLDLEGYTDIA
ncbi:uncharacterized protein ASPGLDRAFT_69849 [Aspergillus glaucus CBS 516.65]|uniref:Uncharacterized protein n=1 Tax=Aspergillus glaucus CBS 516.65 TaxID=1160497 RepID=A0A1L9V717_ASPGL|nr:hypothetical protein ASPGLDRAFT_69849 [Aspergillus glaucus CBS 516.65]OJJ79705.1 hypothetical protein ASPGLDRAFT_69849 [Aspergillus glaucus CBS 516.65]